MKKKVVILPTEDDLLVDLTFHDVSASLLAQFAKKIVRPYYAGNMSKALKDLIRKSIRDEELFISHLKSVESVDHG